MDPDGRVASTRHWEEGTHRANCAPQTHLFLGRKTYEKLAEYWPNRTTSWAKLINPMPK